MKPGSKRFLISHPESGDLFEVGSKEERDSHISNGQCDDVSKILEFEEAFKNKQKNCVHEKVEMMVDPSPHIWACLKCQTYSPKPHPRISHAEVIILIDFAKFVATQAKEKKASKTHSISEKVEHVKRAQQSRGHHCHWSGCKEKVPPARWGCKDHWFRLPKNLRDRIWATYRVGQEETGTPSEAYVHVARQVQDWIDAQELL